METLNSNVAAQIAGLSLRDNLFIILKGEERFFSYTELFEAATRLKLNKGSAPSVRGMKISLSRLSGEKGDFVTDPSHYWFGLRATMGAVDFPAVPAEWSEAAEKPVRDPNKVRKSSGLQGPSNGNPFVEYERVVSAVVAGKNVATARIVSARNNVVAAISTLLNGDYSEDELRQSLILAEAARESEADEIVATETVTDDAPVVDEDEADEADEAEADEEAA